MKKFNEDLQIGSVGAGKMNASNTVEHKILSSPDKR